jgi:hypothetical protein
MSKRATFTYTAKCPACGKIVAASVDDEAYRKGVADSVARWVRDGLEISRVEHASIRRSDWADLGSCGACNGRRDGHRKKKPAKAPRGPLTPHLPAAAGARHAKGPRLP